MGDENRLRELSIVNYLTVNKIYVPLSIKQDEEGNLLLKNPKNPELRIDKDLASIEYNGKTFQINFDEDGKVSSPIKELIVAETKEVAAPAAIPPEMKVRSKPPMQEITPQIKKAPEQNASKEIPKQNVAVAMSPLDRLTHERQKEKGKAEKIKTERMS